MSLENEEDWMKCTDWLVRCGILPEHQKNTISSVEHLAIILKDGVQLCNLLNIIKPGCFEEESFCLKPLSTFYLCQKNIKTFLKVCKCSFGIKEKNLFLPSDLLEMQNFKKVILSLAILSQTNEMKKKRIEPFWADSGKDYTIIQDIMDECEDEYSSSMYGFHANHELNENEEIYDSLVIKRSPGTDTGMTKTEFYLNELFDSEKNFLDVLDNIINKFMKKLKNHITEKEFDVIFNNIKELNNIHSNFYASLKKAQVSKNVVIDTAECFLESKFSFLLYGDYCSKVHLSNIEVYRLIKSNSNFQELLKKCNRDVNLVDLLIIPCQRILKYHLMIKELVKSCHDKPEEEKKMKKALETMEDIGVYINEVKRDYENIQTIHEIKDNIKDIDDFWEPGIFKLEKYGRLHFDGMFDLKDNYSSSYSKRYLILFDKLLIICEPFKKSLFVFFNTKEKDHFSYKRNISIRDCSFEQDDNDSGTPAPIRITDSRNKSVFYLISSNRAIALTNLINYLNIAKNNTKPQGYNINKHEFILTNFNNAVECSECHKLLRGLLSQGYLCRKTDKYFHLECLPKDERVSIKTSNPKKEKKKRNVSKRKHHFDTEGYSWFSLVENRNEASNLLRSCSRGTFLVRWSEEQANYVISIKSDKVRHMVVRIDEDGYYLEKGHAFNTIPLMIEYYKMNSLKEAFPTVDSCLICSFKDAQEMCVALRDFSATERRQLTFLTGDLIQIVSKEAGGGFWRGKLNGERGIFPSTYVEQVS